MVEARLLERVEGPGEVVEGEKDKALIDAFSAAISAALGGEAA